MKGYSITVRETGDEKAQCTWGQPGRCGAPATHDITGPGISYYDHLCREHAEFVADAIMPVNLQFAREIAALKAEKRRKPRKENVTLIADAWKAECLMLRVETERQQHLIRELLKGKTA